QGQQPLRHPDPQALDGARAVALQAELALEGVEDRLDPLADPAQVAEPPGLVSRSGRTRQAPSSATSCSNAPPAKPLSARTTLPGRRRRRRGACATGPADH